MEYPIGTLLYSDELSLGDRFCEEDTFKRGYHLFTRATEEDVRFKSGKKAVIKAVFSENFENNQKVLCKDVTFNSIFMYDNIKYKLSSARADTRFLKYDYIGPVENDAKIIGVIPEENGQYIYHPTRTFWMNANTVVTIVKHSCGY